VEENNMMVLKSRHQMEVRAQACQIFIGNKYSIHFQGKRRGRKMGMGARILTWRRRRRWARRSSSGRQRHDEGGEIAGALGPA